MLHRFAPLRENFIPKDATLLTEIQPRGIQIYTYKTAAGKPVALAFKGRAQRPDWHFSFRTPAQMEEHIKEWLEHLDRWEATKRNYRQDAADKLAAVEIGTIIYQTWGYDQTNVNFYQVVDRTAGTITVRELAQTVKETGFMCGDALPHKDQFRGAPEIKRSLSKYMIWTGRPVACSWYA